MVSKVTVSIFVLCLLICQSSQFPDHNRTRRADDKPSLISKPSFSIDDFQGWLTAVTNVMNNMNIPGASKKPHQGDDKTNEDKAYKDEDKHEDKDKE